MFALPPTPRAVVTSSAPLPSYAVPPLSTLSLLHPAARPTFFLPATHLPALFTLFVHANSTLHTYAHHCQPSGVHLYRFLPRLTGLWHAFWRYHIHRREPSGKQYQLRHALSPGDIAYRRVLPRKHAHPPTRLPRPSRVTTLSWRIRCCAALRLRGHRPPPPACYPAKQHWTRTRDLDVPTRAGGHLWRLPSPASHRA